MVSLELDDSQKARLQEVADLLLDVYKTLAEMRYIDAKGIETGPRDLSSIKVVHEEKEMNLTSLYEEFKLDPSVIYLYSILPSINSTVAGKSDFFHGGSFADFRDPADIEQSRAPFYGDPEGDDYEDEDGPYMYPWYTTLSMLGNHQSVIIYDARRHRIWIIDQEGWSSTDPALQGVPAAPIKSKNRNSFEHVPSRPADDFLRDMKHWFRTLQELPGEGGENMGGEWSTWNVKLKSLYLNAGWPDHFDGDAFQVAQARAYAASTAKYAAEEPLRQVDKYKQWSKYDDQDKARDEKALAEAKTPDEEWSARYSLWKSEDRRLRNAEDRKKKEQELEERCPNGVCQRTEDLPLWELEQLRHELKWNEENENESNEAVIYRKAYEASKADAERLCPGRTFEEATGIKSLGRQDTVTIIEQQKYRLDWAKKEKEKIQTWAEQVPAEAEKTLMLVENDLKDRDRSIENSTDMLKRFEDWLAEHGNTD